MNIAKLIAASFMLLGFLSPIPAWPITLHGFNTWSSLWVRANFTTNRDYYYQFESHLRLNKESHLLRQNIERIRVGKKFKHVRVSLGYDFAPTQFARDLLHEQRAWQQLKWIKPISSNATFFIRNRLEQRIVNQFAGTSWRNRIKFIFIECINGNRIFCPIIYSETHIKLNRVIWDNQNTIAQQWSFIGIQNQVATGSYFNVGYLNQYTFAKKITTHFDIIDFQIVRNFD